jgi:hypothetical protein
MRAPRDGRSPLRPRAQANIGADAPAGYSQFARRSRVPRAVFWLPVRVGRFRDRYAVESLASGELPANAVLDEWRLVAMTIVGCGVCALALSST